MNCPPDIAAVILQILRMGIIRARVFASAKDARKCLLETDHIHNLPDVLGDYRPERLRYYWDVERVSFIRQVPDWERTDLDPLWAELDRLINKDRVPPNVAPLAQQRAALPDPAVT